MAFSAVYKITYWLIFPAFYALMLWFVWPTLDKSFTIMALILVGLLILTPTDHRVAADDQVVDSQPARRKAADIILGAWVGVKLHGKTERTRGS